MLSRAAKSIVRSLHQRGDHVSATNLRTITGPGGQFYPTPRDFKQRNLSSATVSDAFRNVKFQNAISANGKGAIIDGVTAGGGTPIIDTLQIPLIGKVVGGDELFLSKTHSAIHSFANRKTHKLLFSNTTRSYCSCGKKDTPPSKCSKQPEKSGVSPCKKRSSSIPDLKKCGCALEPKCPEKPACPPPCPPPKPPCCPPPKPPCCPPPPCPPKPAPPKCPPTSCPPPPKKCPEPPKCRKN